MCSFTSLSSRFVTYAPSFILGKLFPEKTKDNKGPRNPPCLFFISCCTVSVTPSSNTPKSSNDFMILIIFISSFKIYKVNPFPALAAPFPFIFLSNVFIAVKVKLLTNPNQLSLAKGIATFVSAFFPILANQELKETWLNYFRYLSFPKFYIC